MKRAPGATNTEGSEARARTNGLGKNALSWSIRHDPGVVHPLASVSERNGT